jgi:hypothetical protein
VNTVTNLLCPYNVELLSVAASEGLSSMELVNFLVAL